MVECQRQPRPRDHTPTPSRSPPASRPFTRSTYASTERMFPVARSLARYSRADLHLKCAFEIVPYLFEMFIIICKLTIPGHRHRQSHRHRSLGEGVRQPSGELRHRSRLDSDRRRSRSNARKSTRRNRSNRIRILLCRFHSQRCWWVHDIKKYL